MCSNSALKIIEHVEFGSNMIIMNTNKIFFEPARKAHEPTRLTCTPSLNHIAQHNMISNHAIELLASLFISLSRRS